MICSSKSESAHTRISIMNTAHPRNVASHPIHPPSWISKRHRQLLTGQ